MHFKYGKYSKSLPARLAARAAEAEKDPELTSVRSELALVDARISDLLSRLESGESGQRWHDLREAFEAFERHRQAGDVAKMTQALGTLGRCIERGAREYDTWEQILTAIEQRRKLAETETKRLVLLQQMVTLEQLAVRDQQIVEILMRHIRDRAVLQALVVDLERLDHVDVPGRDRPDLN